MLQAAREWNVAPWVIEQDIDGFWWDAWQALRELEAEARKERAKEAG